MRSGTLWFVLILLPALVVIAGLIAFIYWQASEGRITPKWKKPQPTNPPAQTTPIPQPERP